MCPASGETSSDIRGPAGIHASELECKHSAGGGQKQSAINLHLICIQIVLSLQDCCTLNAKPPSVRAIQFFVVEWSSRFLSVSIIDERVFSQLHSSFSRRLECNSRRSSLQQAARRPRWALELWAVWREESTGGLRLFIGAIPWLLAVAEADLVRREEAGVTAEADDIAQS